jgi:hypothetical protein
MNVNLSKDIKDKIVSEMANWIADEYRTRVIQQKDVDILQKQVEEVTWKYVQQLKLGDPFNERICQLYLVGEVCATIAVAFLTMAAEAAGVTTEHLKQEPVKQTEFFSSGPSKKEVLN